MGQTNAPPPLRPSHVRHRPAVRFRLAGAQLGLGDRRAAAVAGPGEPALEVVRRRERLLEHALEVAVARVAELAELALAGRGSSAHDAHVRGPGRRRAPLEDQPGILGARAAIHVSAVDEDLALGDLLLRDPAAARRARERLRDPRPAARDPLLELELARL